MEIKVNLKEVKELVTSPEFTTFLINHCVDMGTSAFILQSLFERIAYEEAKEKHGQVQ